MGGQFCLFLCYPFHNDHHLLINKYLTFIHNNFFAVPNYLIYDRLNSKLSNEGFHITHVPINE